MNIPITVFEQVPKQSSLSELDMFDMILVRGLVVVDANYQEHSSRYVIYQMEAKAE